MEKERKMLHSLNHLSDRQNCDLFLYGQKYVLDTESFTESLEFLSLLIVIECVLTFFFFCVFFHFTSHYIVNR